MSLFALGSLDLLLYLPDVMRGFLALWLFAVGACVGSFVNVVVLRLPAGESIVRTGSRCPVCLHPIRWFDNIPIMSWLILRARCRDCHSPIATRYPLVELATAVVFLLLGFVEVLSGGWSLPRLAAASSYIEFSAFESWSLYVFHIVAVVTLLSAALIELDCHAVPRRLFVPAFSVGLLASLGLPFVHPVPAVVTPFDFSWLKGLVDASWGVFTGGILGMAAWPATSRHPCGPPAGRTAILATATAGMYVGWQAVAVITVVVSAALLFGVGIGRFNNRLYRVGWCGYLMPSLFVYLILWRHGVERFAVLGADSSWLLPCGAAVIVLLVSTSAAALTPAREFLEHADAEKERMASPIDRDKKLTAILESQSYLPVEYDVEFLQQWETRPVRVQLELLKPEIGFLREHVDSTIVVFGGAQIVAAQEGESKLRAAREALEQSPDDPQLQRDVERLTRVAAKSHYYNMAREFSRLVSSTCQIERKCDYVIITGGGPGIMEAANRGAYEVGAKSVGLNITLPAEQAPNPYVTPGLCFQFHYFAMRKMHFLLRAKALVVFPGGFGTLDELFDALTLRQTRRMQKIPIILFGREFWQHAVDFQFLADEGVIADQHLDLINYAETPQEAWDIITRFNAAEEPFQSLD